MSIVRLVRATLIASLRDKHSVLAELQRMGILHLERLRDEEVPDMDVPSRRSREALDYLLSSRRRHRQEHRSERFDAERIETRALEIRQRVRELSDEADFLRGRIAELRPWGDFHWPAGDSIAGRHLWFYVIPLYRLPLLDRVPLPKLEVHRTNRLSYVVVISDEEPEGMPVARTHTGGVSLSELESRLEDVELEIEDLQAERVSLTRWCDLLSASMASIEDQAALRKAGAQTYDLAPLVAVSGWIPARELHRLERFGIERGVAINVREPAMGDDPPTLLENDEWAAGGEDLVRFYMTPHYSLWDPSLVVLASFLLFFAMIISDAGYALALGTITLLYAKRSRSSAGAQRFWRTCLLLSGASLIWGVLMGSYFGVEPEADSLLAKLQVASPTDANTMMQVSILVGVSHLMLASAVQAWRSRGSFAALGPLGWVILIAGGTMCWLGWGEQASQADFKAGIASMVAGALLVFLFGAESENPLKRVAGGALSLTRITNAFGDAMSYMRLFALGLASASLANTFNTMAGNILRSAPDFGFLFAPVILVLGHGLNLLLAVVGGFVHGLRLNFIEFFGWAVPQEGRPFKPFAQMERPSWNR